MPIAAYLPALADPGDTFWPDPEHCPRNGAWNRVSQNGQRPVLAENISYESYRKDGSKYTDEVKIDVGGKFQKLADLTDEGDRY